MGKWRKERKNKKEEMKKGKRQNENLQSLGIMIVFMFP